MEKEKKRLPICCICENCERDKGQKAWYCNITKQDVGHSRLGLGSPKDCPKRS